MAYMHFYPLIRDEQHLSQNCEHICGMIVVINYARTHTTCEAK